MWNETVVDRLADLRPDVYDGWDGDTTDRRAQAARHRHRPGLGAGEDGKGVNRRGITRADLHKALGTAEQSRELTTGPPPPPDDVVGDDPREEGGERSA